MELRSHADVQRFWLGTTVSALGSFIGSLALAFVLVKTLGVGARSVAAIAVLQLVVTAAAGPVARVAVDRFRRRPLMIAADALRAGAILILPIAYQSHLPNLVGPYHLMAANGMVASTSIAETAGVVVALSPAAYVRSTAR